MRFQTILSLLAATSTVLAAPQPPSDPFQDLTAATKQFEKSIQAANDQLEAYFLNQGNSLLDAYSHTINKYKSYPQLTIPQAISIQPSIEGLASQTEALVNSILGKVNEIPALKPGYLEMLLNAYTTSSLQLVDAYVSKLPGELSQLGSQIANQIVTPLLKGSAALR